MRHRIGELWITLGILHFAIIAILDRHALLDILHDGYLAAVYPDPTRAAAFWLFYLGVPFILTGLALQRLQRATGTIPESFGWTALTCSLLGALAVPGSGFWLVAALAGYGILVSRRDATHPRYASENSSNRTTGPSGTRVSNR